MTNGESTEFGRRSFLGSLATLPVAAALLGACSNTSTVPIGPDMAGADKALRPVDDLYRYVNGSWLRDYQLPDDKSRYGSFDEISDRTREQLRAILESIGDDASAGSIEQKLRDLYRAHLDLDTIEKLGLSPITDLLESVDKAVDKPALAKVMGELSLLGVTTPIGLGVTVDSKDSTKHIAEIDQAGLGLPDEAYYRDPQYTEQRAAYRTFLEQIATAAHLPDPAGSAQRVLDLETRIAAGHWDHVRTRDTLASYNPRSWDEVRAAAPTFDWDGWLAAQHDKPEQFRTLIVGQPSYLTTIGQLWSEVDVPTWQEYLRLQIISGFASSLPKVFADAAFDFSGKALSGVRKRPDRWKTAVSLVNGQLGFALGKKYVDKHFPADAKQRADELVATIREVYRDRFMHSDWMSQPTREAALAKLAKIDPKIGYPENWRDYSGFTVTNGQLVATLRAGAIYESKRQFAKLAKPVDRSEWSMTPQTVNAYYNAPTNQIVFPAAILQAPFFDKDAEPAVNYGAIGAIIGHEMGHGFDDQGSRYDGDGNLREWWTPADREAFDKKTKMLIDQYNVLVPQDLKPDQHVDGALTVGENLADLRGFAVSLDAFRIAERKRGVSNPDFHPVFLAWARTWREKIRPAAEVNQISTDPHSPAEFRCNQVVRNLPEFYATFGVQPADKLYLPPEQRVKI